MTKVFCYHILYYLVIDIQNISSYTSIQKFSFYYLILKNEKDEETIFVFMCVDDVFWNYRLPFG